MAHDFVDMRDLAASDSPAAKEAINLFVYRAARMLASLAGKNPPDQRYWIVTGDVPAFVRFKGALFLNGPVWRIEMTTLEWPK